MSALPCEHTTAQLLALFDQYCEAGSMSPGTRSLRRNYLRRFTSQYDPMTCTPQDIAAWLTANPRWKASTRASARSALTSFFSWARKMGHRVDDPAADTHAIKVGQSPPKPCPESVLTDALAKADERSRRAILLGAYAGLRRAEIAGLHADHIDLETMSLRIRGKGDKTRIVPIADALVDELTAAKARGGYLFPNQFGNPVTPTTIGRLVSPLLGEGHSTHALRHRFATKVFSGSRNLRATQELLGHSSIATTQRYTQVSDEERREAVAVLAAM